MTTTLIKDLIDIPERVHKGGFVLKLTEGVDRSAETLRHYVVTPQLRACFDHALAFIKSAVDSRFSKAAYLHGSFGSGKSHFMAVLHLLLQNHPEARALPDLSSVVAEHGDWLGDKKLLLVPFHMIGATSFESALLGGYVAHMNRRYPEAPTPGVYQSFKLFDNARSQRADYGDDAFFAALNKNKQGGDDDWGDLGADWEAGSLEEAMAAPPTDPRHIALVGDLVDTLFPAFQDQNEYVSVDEGLSVLSQHAHQLGYDGLILFLDELILWLASHVADPSFIAREIQKVIKLIEFGAYVRPTPIISFVARQRDLKELVGDTVPGAQQVSFVDQMKHWEGRFDLITLEDRNLPVIAEKRVLRPRSEAARTTLQTAFDASAKLRAEALDTLLTAEGDKAMFRQVYPFSPALMQALVALSSVLQRERTALKVMLQLLVNQRETLALGQIVPVGDLYDAIADEAEPFTSDMRRHFDNARLLYRRRLLPMLEKEHGVTEEAVQALPPTDAKRHAFLTDDRLVKTLLLSALVPDVACFKGLTASRLAALNHGTVRSPIPGRETGEVLRRCRKWAGQVGEIKIGEEPTNPTLSVQLTGVDIETILDKARNVDNGGSRAKKIREILFRELDVPDSDALFGIEITHLWRGTPRLLDVVFANVREMALDSLKGTLERWKVVIDFPFDADGFTPQDDLAALDNFRSRNAPSHTLCWLPSFFSRDVLRDLGTLVIMDHVLTSDDRFRDYAGHLSEVERSAARSLMDNQRNQLRQHVLNSLEGAYGVEKAAPGTLDGTHHLADHFQSLDPTFTPKPPVAANLKGGFQHLLDQALEHQFPAHPHFQVKDRIRTRDLQKVLDLVGQALETPDGRLGIDRKERDPLRQIAAPLKLGEMHETHFVLSHHWHNHFDRKIAGAGGQVSVENLRTWTDDPKPMGLPSRVQNLLILLFARQTNRVFRHQGGTMTPGLDGLPDDATLHQQNLPDQILWEKAVDRAGPIFGVSESRLCTAGNLVSLAKKIGKEVDAHLEATRTLSARLRSLPAFLALPDETPRHQSAASILSLLEKLKQADANGMVAHLAEWMIPTSEEALGSSLKKAAAVALVLENTKWDLLEGAWGLTDHRQDRVRESREKVINALSHDELTVPLAPVLQTAESEAVALLAYPASRKKPKVKPGTGGGVQIPPRAKVPYTIEENGIRPMEAKQILRDIERKLDGFPDTVVSITVRIEGKEE